MCLRPTPTSQELKDAEAEHLRVQAEGPAHHRKRDLLDKATKEAEHRERLADLQARMAAAKERVAADEASTLSWATQHQVRLTDCWHAAARTCKARGRCKPNIRTAMLACLCPPAGLPARALAAMPTIRTNPQ